MVQQPGKLVLLARIFPTKVDVPVPFLTEQEHIVSELERCLSIADEVEMTIVFELTRAERLRQSILKHAFSGKLVPQDADDEQASVLLEQIRGEKERQQPKQREKTMLKSKTPDSGTDPLLALAGTLECDVTDIKKHYSDPVSPKIRVVKGAHEDNPDPLLALAGTLECDVTDIGERHDEYIGDALLAELWGDEDE